MFHISAQGFDFGLLRRLGPRIPDDEGEEFQKCFLIGRYTHESTLLYEVMITRWSSDAFQSGLVRLV